MKGSWSKKKVLGGMVVLIIALVSVVVAVPAMAQTGNGNGLDNTYSGIYFDSPTLTRLANVMEITPMELSNQLQTGKTLATIAQEKNITTAPLVEAIIAPCANQIASQLKSGHITQEQSQALLDTARQQAGNLLGHNLSVAPDNKGCYYGYGCGTMGLDMMSSWGGCYNNNPTLAPDSSSSNNTGGTNVPAQPWNGCRGGGMMGNGCL